VGAAAAVAGPAPVGRDAQPWDLTHRAYNTWEGTTGGIFIEDPGMAEPGSVRVQLGLDTYSGHGFLYAGDHVQQDRQSLSISWTALDLLEVYGSIQNRATVADKPKQNSLHSLGDTLVGVKLVGRPAPIWRMGGGVRLFMQGDVGAKNTVLNATSFGLRGDVALDLQGLDQPVPFIARFNADYMFDNSANVLDDIEDRRYAGLSNALPRVNETRNLITRVERFGLGVNRVDMFTLGLGFEVPLQVAEGLFLHPTLDYRLGLPVNRRGYNCAYHSKDSSRGTNKIGADDTCLDDAGASAWPMSLAIGVRVVPPVRGLSALLAGEFGLSGTDTFVRELVPTTPFRFIIAAGYDYDARPPPAPPAAPPPPPPAAAPPPKGRLIGQVTDQASGQPIAGVVVRIANTDLSPVATDQGGHFTSYELDPGEFELELSHPDYEPRRCASMIAASGGEAAVLCTLSALPMAGSLKVSVHDQFGATVAGARVQIAGPTPAVAASDMAGELVANDLQPGQYTARVESESHLVRVASFSIERRQQTRMEIALLRKPAKSSVELKGKEIRAAKLKFAKGSVELSADAAQAVAELADLLLREPSLRRLRIQADGGEGLALTRALAIKQRLVESGVPDIRLEAATESGSRVTLTWLE
jgi:outer membrane protein OmpA-like peptidoglycan-associated protein